MSINMFYFFVMMLCTKTLSNALVMSENKENNLVEYNVTENQTNLCENHMTFDEMKKFLKEHSCLFMEIECNSIGRRYKRWGESTNNKINAIHATIHEQRNMINFLFNNSINTTILTNTISDHHSKKGPQLTSRRDIIDLILVALVVLYIIYLIIFRAGCSPCNNFLLYLSKTFTRRV
ncbi:unnamed protein product [Rotaria sp. Silwood2]|nr:unnamed protein product [Rotaria sp. Silwood2]